MLLGAAIIDPNEGRGKGKAAAEKMECKRREISVPYFVYFVDRTRIHEIHENTKYRKSLTAEEFFKYYSRMNQLFAVVLAFALLVTVNATAPAQKRKTPAKGPTASVKPISTSKVSTAVTVNPALNQLSTYEKQLLDEINYARANPQEYLKALELFRRNYRGNEIHYPEGGVIVTNEGVAAIDDAIAFVRKLKPLPPLDLRTGMVKAAKAHVNDLVSSGKSGHRGLDGSQPGERLDRFGRWAEAYGENIVYESRTPRYDVIGMIIDDGTANRGHRENLFAEDFRVIGIAAGKRLTGQTLGVVTFAVGYRDK